MSSQLNRRPTGYLFDGSYELVSTLGRGACSITYKAHPIRAVNRGIHLPNVVAVKVLTNTAKNFPETVKRVRRETLAHGRTASQNVIHLFDSVASEDLCYLVLEYAQFGNLQDILDRYPSPLSPARSLKLLIQILNGLEIVHRAGIIHRDIKPANLLVTDRSTIKVSDFSIALLLEHEHELGADTRSVGTLDYASPEFLTHGDVSKTSDYYAATVTCYQLMTKHFPFDGQDLGRQLNRKVSGVRTQLSEYVDYETTDLENLFDRALNPDQHQRFQSVREFRLAIESVLQGERYLRKAPAQRPVAASRVLSNPRSTSLDLSPAAVAQCAPITNLTPTSSDFIGSRNAHRSMQLEKLRAGRIRTRTTHLDLSAFQKQQALQAQAWKKRFAFAATSCLVLLVLGTGSLLFSARASAVALLIGPLRATMEGQSLSAGLKEFFTVDRRPYTAIKPLSTGVHVGILKNFLADSYSLPFTVRGVGGSNKLVFALSLPGYIPRSIVLSPDSASNEIRITGHGINLSLWINLDLAQSNRIGGNYREHNSNREGGWEITSSFDQ